MQLAERAGTSWTFETVDSSRVGKPKIAFAYDSAGNPGAAYGTAGALFAYRDAGGWNIESIESGDTSWASLAFDTTDRPNVSYQLELSDGSQELKFAVKDAGVWTIDVVDTHATRVGNPLSLAIDPTTDYPAIAYRKGPSSGPTFLRYARRDGSGWTNEVDIESQGAFSMSLDFDAFGTPYVGYAMVLDPKNCGGELRVAQFDGIAWVIETIQGMGDACVARYSLSLEVDLSNTPSLSYRDQDNGKQLRFATKN